MGIGGLLKSALILAVACVGLIAVDAFSDQSTSQKKNQAVPPGKEILIPSVILESLPEGWRKPVQKDFESDWESPDKTIPHPAITEADFSGDKIQDYACFLFREDGEGWSVFAFLGKESNQLVAIQLSGELKNAHALGMGIDTVQPGTYKTACGKGYWDCEKGEPEVLTLVYPAIDFYKFESANSVFWWDKVSKSFKHTWMSD